MMKTIMVTAARRHIGELLNAVQQAPILICRKNGDKAVMISAERYKQLYRVQSFESEPVKPARKRTSPRKLRWMTGQMWLLLAIGTCWGLIRGRGSRFCRLRILSGM